MSQEELAEKAGLTVRTIGNIEAGRITFPRPATVRLLANALNLGESERDRFHAAAIPRGPVPRQLPAVPRHFVGRADELESLDMLVGGDIGGAVVISVIGGAAGIGKTTLVLHWAQRIADRFPDGQLYVDLRGFGPTGVHVSPSDALRGFLEALEVPANRIPVSVDDQAALYRSLMAGRGMLVVLDNASDSDQVRPLLPAGRDCLVVVTSRNQLTGLVAMEGARPITIDSLSNEEAWELLAQRLGQGRLHAEAGAVTEIIEYCAGLPLALVVVAARAAINPILALADLASDLSADHLASIKTVLSWSYDVLTSGAARLFRLLALHPGPDFTAPVAASLVGEQVPVINSVLAELTSASLVVERTPGRYAFHDVLRMYATDLVAQVESELDRRGAYHRLLDHYVHTAFAGNRLLDPHRRVIAPAVAQPASQPERLVDEKQALAWFSVERATLLALIDSGPDWDVQVWKLTYACATFLHRQGRWYDFVHTHELALRASRRLGDADMQGIAHRNIARGLMRLDRSDEALAHLRTGLALAIEVGDVSGQANAHLALSSVLEKEGRDREALAHTEGSFELFEALGDQRGQATALNNIGLFHIRLGEYDQAIVACRRALAMHEGRPDGVAAAWDNLGTAHHKLGDDAESISCYRKALELLRELGDRHHEAMVLTHLADVLEAIGDTRQAEETRREARSLLDSMDDR